MYLDECVIEFIFTIYSIQSIYFKLDINNVLPQYNI